MGLYDRDYMRKRPRRRDSYLDRRYEMARSQARRTRWTWPRTMLVTFVLVFGVLVMPQFTIAGHHWRIWFV